MTDTHPTLTAAREVAIHLTQLGNYDHLSAAQRQACLAASEWLADYQQLRTRLENAEAFLNDELRRHESTLAQLYRRHTPPHRPRTGADLLDNIRQIRRELEQALPVSPRSVPFAVSAG